MTPGIEVAIKNKITHSVHEYTHDSSSESYGLEASEKLGVSAGRVFKTLVVFLNTKQLAVAVIPVSSSLSMKKMAKATGAKKAEMAQPSDVEKSTGYVLGGVSPLGQKKKLKTIIDSSAEVHETIYISAGRRGLELELSPADLQGVLGGLCAEITQ